MPLTDDPAQVPRKGIYLVLPLPAGKSISLLSSRKAERKANARASCQLLIPLCKVFRLIPNCPPTTTQNKCADEKLTLTIYIYSPLSVSCVSRRRRRRLRRGCLMMMMNGSLGTQPAEDSAKAKCD